MVSIFLFTSQPIGRPGSGEHFGLGVAGKTENRGQGKTEHQGLGKNENPPRPVRTKTFSTHVMPKIHHDVRKSGAFTHEKVRPETSYESGRTDESINLICQVSIKR